MANIRKQVPTTADNWLHDEQTDYNRVFAKVVYLGVNATEWAECTDAEKVAWEEAHPHPQPTESAE